MHTAIIMAACHVKRIPELEEEHIFILAEDNAKHRRV